MIYVLFFFFSRGGASFTQEFNTEAACNHARAVISQPFDSGRVVAVCVPKG